MDLEIRAQRYDPTTQCICVAGFGMIAHYGIKATTCKTLRFLHIHSILGHEGGSNLISPLRSAKKV